MEYNDERKYDVIYSDYIYQNNDFSWLDKYWDYLKPNGVFICQTDDSTQAEIKIKLNSMKNSFFYKYSNYDSRMGRNSKKRIPKET